MISFSLRLRLMLLILCPLFIIGLFAVGWRFIEAQRTAEDIFDRTLTALALAVSRDVAISGGDSLSVATRDLMSRASGGLVYYHVKGPDGSYVTGYAYPPQAPDTADEALSIFDTRHQNQDVRAVLLTERVTADGVQGHSTTMVWQQQSLRSQFAIALASKAATLMALLILAVTILIFFGVRFGLKPLVELEDAIAKRSPNDLTVIKRKIPPETQGIVDRLNALFKQLSMSFEARDRLISNAAHQLKNPVAAIQSMAEVAQSASTIEDMRSRVKAITQASVHASRLTTQMLALEKLQSDNSVSNFKYADLIETLNKQCMISAHRVLAKGLEFSFEGAQHPIYINHDEILIGEAVENLIHNAIEHGGDALTYITVTVLEESDSILIIVENDGTTVPKENREHIFERFSQGSGSNGSGLGLSIVEEISRLHGGSCELVPNDAKTCFKIILPKTNSIDGTIIK